MIQLTGTQTVSEVTRSLSFIDATVIIHMEYAPENVMSIHTARKLCYVAYRMSIETDDHSGDPIVHIYNY